MKRYLIGILTVALLITLMQPTLAAIPITITDTGCTFIQWNWSSGLNIAEMQIDSIPVTDYNPTDPGYLLNNLHIGEAHDIRIVAAGEVGTSTAFTDNMSLCRSSSSFSSMEESPVPAWVYPVTIVLALLIYRGKD